MDPLNYTIAAPNPIAGALQGYAQGVGINDLQNQQAAQQRALAQQQQQTQVIQSLVSNKNATADDYANAQLLVPQLSEQLGKAWANKNDAQQQTLLTDLSQWGAAIQNGQPNIAVDAMKSRADAMENTAGAPTPESKALRSQADAIAAHPEFGGFMIKSLLAAHPKGKSVIDNIVSLGKEGREAELAPAALRSANAKAGEAEVDGIQKRDAVIGSAAGALLGKGATVGQITTMLRSKAKQGLIAPDDAQTYIDTIPSDPKAREQWLSGLQGAGLKPEEQVKLTTPDANARLQAQTSKYATDSAAGTAAARLKFDKDKEEGKGQGLPLALTTSGKTGADFLAQLDKPVAAQVKALTEGRMAFPVGKAAQSDYWQKMIAAVAQYDPSFDAVNYSARSKARNDLVAGKTGGNIKALNTAIAHMGQLNDQLTALDNGDIPAVNVVRNWAAKSFGFKDRQNKIAAANTTAEGVAGEMAKVFRETGMSEHEINAWREKFIDSTTPSAQKGTFKSAMHMLNGRIDAIQDQYKTGMGTTAAPLDILTDKSKAIFDNLMDEPHAAPAKAAKKPQTAKPTAAPALPGGWTVREH